MIWEDVVYRQVMGECGVVNQVYLHDMGECGVPTRHERMWCRFTYIIWENVVYGHDMGEFCVMGSFY